jgi:hypothetical protein
MRITGSSSDVSCARLAALIPPAAMESRWRKPTAEASAQDDRFAAVGFADADESPAKAGRNPRVADAMRKNWLPVLLLRATPALAQTRAESALTGRVMVAEERRDPRRTGRPRCATATCGCG